MNTHRPSNNRSTLPARSVRIPSAALAAAAFALLLASGCGRRQQAGAAQGMPPAEVATVVIKPEQVVLTTELPGRTTPYLIAEIRPQVSGLILKRLFTEGSDVTAGQELYQIDPAPFQAAYDSAMAALGRAEAVLPAARSRAERFRQALADKAVSQQDFDDADAAIKQAEADALYWKAAAENARINLGYTRIVSPISGRIGRSSVTDGAIVTAYQPVALATIQQLDPIYVDVPQSTNELLRLERRIAQGQISPDGDNANMVQLIMGDGVKYSMEGTLQFRDVSVDPTTASVTLRAVFQNPKAELLPNMFVRAIVKEGVSDNAILVPQQAVSRDTKGNPVALVVNQAGVVEMRLVGVDRTIGDRWLVSSGFAAGDHVIVEGMQKVRPGMPVREVPYGAATQAAQASK